MGSTQLGSRLGGGRSQKAELGMYTNWKALCNCESINLQCPTLYKSYQHLSYVAFSRALSFQNLSYSLMVTRYVEQLVGSAEAAAEEVIRRGVNMLWFFLIILTCEYVIEYLF